MRWDPFHDFPSLALAHAFSTINSAGRLNNMASSSFVIVDSFSIGLCNYSPLSIT